MSAVLQIEGLHCFRGHSHVLQGVDLELSEGVTGLVGRNGMGKSTLAESVMGLLRPRGGSVRLNGRELAGLAPHVIARAGVALVPQGRRLFPSLTVADHLRMVSRRGAAWTMANVLEMFPRLSERLTHGAAQLSGGEQQMLAIGRALMQGPTALILDEPSEGLAPVIVEELGHTIRALGDGGLAILLIEQNLDLVAGTIAGNVSVMENGTVTEQVDTSALTNEKAVRERVLGVAFNK